MAKKTQNNKSIKTGKLHGNTQVVKPTTRVRLKTRQNVNEICRRYANGKTLNQSCTGIVSVQTFITWRKTDPVVARKFEFAERAKQAKLDSQKASEADLIDGLWFDLLENADIDYSVTLRDLMALKGISPNGNPQININNTNQIENKTAVVFIDPAQTGVVERYETAKSDYVEKLEANKSK